MKATLSEGSLPPSLENKIVPIEELTLIFNELKAHDKTVGVIGGCFDVLHMGHIDLFRYAKKHVDFLCVLLDNDETITASKGDSRPLFSESLRAEQLAELESVDIAVVWDTLLTAGTKKTDETWRELLKLTQPDFYITNKRADTFWHKKEKLCKELDIQFLGYKRNRISSSTEIMNQMLEQISQKGF